MTSQVVKKKLKKQSNIFLIFFWYLAFFFFFLCEKDFLWEFKSKNLSLETYFVNKTTTTEWPNTKSHCWLCQFRVYGIRSLNYYLRRKMILCNDWVLTRWGCPANLTWVYKYSLSSLAAYSGLLNITVLSCVVQFVINKQVMQRPKSFLTLPVANANLPGSIACVLPLMGLREANGRLI